jgi:hypothetical protein
MSNAAEKRARIIAAQALREAATPKAPPPAAKRRPRPNWAASNSAGRPSAAKRPPAGNGE